MSEVTIKIDCDASSMAKAFQLSVERTKQLHELMATELATYMTLNGPTKNPAPFVSVAFKISETDQEIAYMLFMVGCQYDRTRKIA